MFAVQCETLYCAKKKNTVSVVDFYVAVTSQTKLNLPRSLLTKDITIIVDTGEGLAKACGCILHTSGSAHSSQQQIIFQGKITIVHDYCIDPIPFCADGYRFLSQ